MFDISGIGFTYFLIPLVIITIMVLGNAFIGCWLAGKKGYSQVAWFYLCFFFGIFALLALGFAPPKSKKQIQQNQETQKSP